jgi:acyl-CoA thioesterase
LSAFDTALELEPAGDGRYRATVGPEWNGPAAPNGGVLTALMVRAAEARLGAEAPPVRTVAAHFLNAPRHGGVAIEVEVLRSGKRVAACDVRMRDEDRLLCQTTVLCSAPRRQAIELAVPAPDAPASDAVEALDLTRVPAAPPVFAQVELRPVFGPAIFSGARNALTGGWMRVRGDDAPLDSARLCALSDLWWPAIYGSLAAPAAAATLELTVHIRRTRPGARYPVLARFETQHVQEGHLEERGQLWSPDGELLAESQQLALLHIR